MAILLRTVMLVLVLSASSWAAGPQASDGNRPAMCKPPFERSIEALKPPADLEKKLRAIAQNQGDVLRQARSDMRDKKRALYQGLEKEFTKESDLKALFKDYDAASSALNSARFESELQVWRLLTPEQRKVWFTYRKCSRDGVMMPPASAPKGSMMDHNMINHQMPPKASPAPMEGDAPMDER